MMLEHLSAGLLEIKIKEAKIDGKNNIRLLGVCL